MTTLPQNQAAGAFAHGSPVLTHPVHGGLIPVHGGVVTPQHGAEYIYQINEYANYALALDFDSNDFWVSGTNYGTGSTELVPNGTFDTATGWTVGTNQSISGGKLNFTGASDGSYISLSSDPSGQFIRVVCDVTITSGSVALYRPAGGFSYPLVAGRNDFTVFVPTGGNVNMGFTGTLFTGSVDNFSLKFAAPSSLPGYTYTRTGVKGELAGGELLGSELIVNGNGSSIVGWTAGAANVTLSLVGGRLRVTNTLGGGSPYAHQSFSTVVGKRYKLVSSGYNVAGYQAQVTIGVVPGGSTIVIETDQISKTSTFVATATTTVISLWVNSVAVGSYAEFDNVSIKEIVSDVTPQVGAELVEHTQVSDYNFATNVAFQNLSWVSGGLLIEKLSDGAGVRQGVEVAPPVGKAYRVQGSITVSEKGRVLIDSSVAVVTRTGTNYLVNATAPGTYTFDELVHVLGGGNFNIVAEVASDAAWSANGATLKINSLSAKPANFIDYQTVNEPAIIPGVGYWARGSLTNALTYSQDFGTGWGLTLGTITSNVSVAPDGTTTVDRFTTTGSPAAIGQIALPVAASTTRTCSVFVPKTGNNFGFAYWQVNLGGTPNAANVGFNLATGAVGTPQTLAGAGVTGTAYAVDCGAFWRLVFVYQTGADTTAAYYLGPSDTLNGRAIAANGNLHLWQAQDILGNHPDGGPIIATAAATVTVGADTWTETFAALGDVDFTVEVVVNNLPYGGANLHIFTMGNNPNLMVRREASNTVQLVQDYGVANNNVSTGAGITTGKVAIIARRKSGKYSVAAKYGGTTTISAETGILAQPAGTNLSFDPTGWALKNWALKRGTVTDAELTSRLEVLYNA